MRVAIIGAGPTGLFLGAALARRGHRVTAVDRDPGPAADGTWPRRGVMQFHHAHAFRPQVVTALQEEVPEALAEWRAAGAELVPMGPPGSPLSMRSRRATFERALRAAVARQPGLELRHGHVDAVLQDRGRARGLRVDGADLPADLVIDASGRSGRVTRGLRGAPQVHGDTGIAYVDRQYRLLPGAEPGPLVNPIAWQADLDGYQVILFLHEHGTFSVLLVRPVDEPDLVHLRHTAVFEAVCRAIPGLADWTDPARSRPIGDVRAGGALVNHYRGQTGPDERLALPGLVFVGDSVCTTTPIFGRGITTSLLQARELLRLLDEHGTDAVAVGERLHAWGEQHMRPWVEDHVAMDLATRRRWSGADLDLSTRLPSDLIMAAARVDPTIGAAIGPYLGMEAGPDSLDAVEPRARAVYESGWRPTPSPGPNRRELVELVRSTMAPV
jgi:2-polyprenyl-6-methoxyphenol hydroxylase-like FAD-dependent oxidoreductase